MSLGIRWMVTTCYFNFLSCPAPTAGEGKHGHPHPPSSFLLMDCIQAHATLTSHREVALRLLLNAEGAFNCPTERIAWGQVSLDEALGKRGKERSPGRLLLGEECWQRASQR